MKNPISQQPVSVKRKVIGQRAFAAITAVEGLKLGKASRERLQALQQDTTLTPDQRRAEVLRAYVQSSRKK